jgi:hypothetical protein
MCGAPDCLPAFGARTFQVISQYGSGTTVWLNALNTCKLNKLELNTT